jgi:serine/threonine protein kinase/Tfp pilus assembly protein PilF
MIGRILSHYRILKQIGAGGMGIVYEAEDLIDGRKVAIKTLKNLDSQKARFLREAKAISNIDHPNIASFYDYGETVDKQPFIVMELVKGKPLDELIKNGSLNLSQIVAIIEKVAYALSAAHKQGIIHRDIKPSNIVVEGDTVKVLDFGISKQLEITDKADVISNDSLAVITETQNGMILGTPLYLSPEQASGEQVDARSDIFSLGAVLYESIAGKSPFYAESVMEICASILRDDPPRPSRLNPTVPSSLDKVTLRALAKKPKNRYQSAAAMIDDLHGLQKALSAGKTLPTWRPFPFRHSISQRFPTGFVDIVRHPYLLPLIFLLTVSIGFLIYNYRLFYPIYTPTQEAKLWYDKGVEALNNGAPFLANGYFEQAIIIDKAFAMAYARHAESLLEMGNIDEASAEKDRAYNTAANGWYSISPKDSIRLKAINNTLLGDFAAAVKNYRQLLDNVSEADKAGAFLDLGKALERNDELTEAIENYENGSIPDSGLFLAYLRLGLLYGRKQQMEMALALFDIAKRSYNAQDNSEGEIEMIYQRSVLISAMEDATRMRAETEDALEKADAGKIIYQQIRCRLALSKILRSSGKYNEAQPYAEQALSLALQNDIEDLHAQSLLELGTVYLFQHKKEDAKNTYEEALGIARQYGLTVVEKRTLLQLGSLYVNINHEADPALDYVSQVEDFFRQGNYKKEIFDLLSIKAQALNIKGDLPAAIDIYNQLSVQADEVGNRMIKARAQKGAGTIMYAHDDFNRALDPLFDSFSIFNSINRVSEAGYSWFLYADALLQLGRYQEAGRTLLQAEGMAQKNSGLTPDIDLIKAKMALSKRQFAATIKVCKKIFAEDRDTGNQKKELPSTTEARTIIALAFARSGEKAKSKDMIEKIDLGAEFEKKETLAKVHLARAEIMLDNGRNNLAADAAQKAQEQFNRLGKPAFEWQAWLLLSQAQNRLKDIDAEKASSANWVELFSTLKQTWGEEDFKSYSERPDIKYIREKT